MLRSSALFAVTFFFIAALSFSACSPRSHIDDDPPELPKHTISDSFSSCSFTELNKKTETGDPFFLLFIPEKHPFTSVLKEEVRQLKMGPGSGLGAPTIVVSYQYALDSPDVDELRKWSQSVSISKDPALVLVKHKNELSREWFVGVPLAAMAKTQLERAREDEGSSPLHPLADD